MTQLFAQDYSDDEEEKNAKSRLKEKRKVDPAIELERAEKRRLKEEKIQESTVYICGLPPDFRERDIKGKGFKQLSTKIVLIFMFI